MGLAFLFGAIPIAIFAVAVWYFLASFLRRDQPIIIQILLVFAALALGILVAGFISAAACIGIMSLSGGFR